MSWIFYALCVVALIYVILLAYEIKRAPLLPDNVPFLHDDYDDEADPTNKHISIFCSHCIKNIDGMYCNNGKHLRKIGDEMIEECKKENYFEAK